MAAGGENPPSYESVLREDRGRAPQTHPPEYLSIIGDSGNYYSTPNAPNPRSQTADSIVYYSIKDSDVYTIGGRGTRKLPSAPSIPPSNSRINPSDQIGTLGMKNTCRPRSKFILLALLGIGVIILLAVVVTLWGNWGGSAAETSTIATTTKVSYTTTTTKSTTTYPQANTQCLNGGSFLGTGCYCKFPYYGFRCEHVAKSNTCDVKWTSVGIASPSDTSNGQTHHCSVCPQNRYSCNSEVHMISVYQPEGSVRGFRQRPQIVPELPVTVVGSSSHSPITLVLTTYEAAKWVVKLPPGVSVSNIFMFSYYLDESSVKVFDAADNQLNTYQLHRQNDYVDYEGVCHTSFYYSGYNARSCTGIDKVLETVTSQYGCFVSFSGHYVVDSWTLNLDSNNC